MKENELKQQIAILNQSVRDKDKEIARLNDIILDWESLENEYQ